MKFHASASSVFFLASLVAGHGYVTNGTIGGTSYTFYQPYQDPYTSPTPERISRPIQGNGPVSDVTLQDIQCGGYTAGGYNGSSPAALNAAVDAGTDVTLYWTLWPESHIGATVTYMARCPDTGCQDYMPYSDAVWFKVAEQGLIDKSTNEWAVTPLMTEPNSGYTYTIPSCLASGYYLVRHEIIAVFVANTVGGVQIYPSCHQLEVTSSGTETPSDLVSFPGAYGASDPGIVWDSSSSTYPIPGPSLYTCDGSSGSQATSTASSAAKSTSTAAAGSSAASVTQVSSSAAVAKSSTTAAATTSASKAATTSSVSVAAAAVTTSGTSLVTAAASSSTLASSAAAKASTTKACKKRRHARDVANE